jgi:hypothetical protein
MTCAAIGFARRNAISYFVAAVEFVVAMQLANLVIAIALVLALGLRVVASIGASCDEQPSPRCD